MRREKVAQEIAQQPVFALHAQDLKFSPHLALKALASHTPLLWHH